MKAFPRSAEGARPWGRTLALAWWSYMVSMMGYSSVLPQIPLYMEWLGAGSPERAALLAGLAEGGFGLAMGGLAPLWGALGDRFGLRKQVLRTTLLAGLVMALAGLVQNPYQMVAQRVLLGLTAGISATMVALVGALSPRDRLAHSMGILQSAFYVGSTLGPILGGAVATAFGFRTAFWVSGGLLVLSGGMVALSLPEARGEEGGRGRVYNPWRAVREVVGMPGVRTVLALSMLVYLGPWLLQPVLPLYLKEMTGVSGRLLAGGAFSLLNLAGAVASYGVAHLSGRVPLPLLLAGASAGASALYGPLGLVHRADLALAMVFGAGFFVGAMVASATALLGLAVPRERQGTAYGLMLSANSVAFGGGPAVGGVLAGLLGLRGVFPVTLAVFAGIAGLALRVRRVVRT